MKDCVFIREGGLGDILMCIPTIEELSKTHQIYFFTKPEFFTLLRLSSCIVKDVLSLPKQIDKTFLQKEGIKDNPVIFDLRNQLENFKIERNKKHRIDSIAEYCGITIEDRNINYLPTQEAKNFSQAFYNTFTNNTFTNNTFTNNTFTIGIAWLSAYRGRSWMDTYVRDLCSFLSRPSIKIILLGDKQERGFEGNSIINTCGYLTIDETAAIIQKLDVLVSTDNGLLHVAGILGIPVIALFGSLPPEVRTKYYNCINITPDNISCYPCWEWQEGEQKDRNYCKNVDILCMRSIKPLKIYYEIIKQIKEGK